MAIIRLNSAQVLSRMKRGEALTRKDFTACTFPDGARPGAGVLERLLRAGDIIQAPPPVGAAFTLPQANLKLRSKP